LRTAIGDENLQVRIWAHYALAILEGNVGEHRAAIAEIAARRKEGDDFVSLSAQEALQWLSMPQPQRDLEAFAGFCITGDMDDLRRLVGQVDVNGRDHNGTTPLEYAIGNDHPDVVEFLLAHGARRAE
jgi:hypothetical protein